MILKKTLIILFSIVFYACKTDTKTNLNKFNPYINLFKVDNNIDLNKDINNIILIPNEGCGNCISNTTMFFKNNTKYLKNNIIIFTGVNDIKQLKISIGVEFLGLEHVYIDSKNYFAKSELSSVYPQILNIKNNKVLNNKLFDEYEFKKLY